MENCISFKSLLTPCGLPPDVAMTLNNLSNLYRDTQRLQEAEAAYHEAQLFKSPK